MEVIKTLPAVFEEFSEQRRNSFLHAYEIKEKNIPFVGTFCTYTPNEVIMAAGAIPVGLSPSRMKPSQKQSRTCPETSAHW